VKNIPVIIPYIDTDETNEVAMVLASGWVAQGTKVAEFERQVASYANVQYGIATTSCTTALHLALIQMGVNENHDVIVPSFTFTASSNSVLYTGGTPILVDVLPDTYNIDPVAIEALIASKYDVNMINKQTGKQLKAIMAVSLFGLCADLIAINEIAKKYSLLVLQDSACAFGAKINNVSEAAFGNMSCLSFHPRKSITTGEGGMVLTNDPEAAKRIMSLRSHGASVSEVDRHNSAGYLLPEFNELGYNYRMTDIQAAVGVAQMRKMEFITNTRREKASFYDKLIKEMGVDFIKPPYVPGGYYHTYQSYVCVIDLGDIGLDNAGALRNEIMSDLEKNGIASRVGTHANHMLGHYRDRYGFKPEDFPVSHMLDKLSITLPLYVQMTEQDQIDVLQALLNAKTKLMGA